MYNYTNIYSFNIQQGISYLKISSKNVDKEEKIIFFINKSFRLLIALSCIHAVNGIYDFYLHSIENKLKSFAHTKI